MLPALLASLALATAQAGTARIDATVADDLRSVSGTLTLPAELGASLVDPLADLPEPPDDLWLLRTYPGRPDAGAVTWTEQGPGVYAFTATLPRRYGDLGWTREGLFANGGWYPQPVLADQPLPTLDWEVRLTLPEGRLGALGDDVGAGTLSWTGTADRTSLAVLRRARITHLAGDHWSVDLLTPGRARPVLVRELVRTLDATASDQMPLRGAVIEGPLRRRLVRPGVDQVALSDRAFRLTPPLQRFHRVAVSRGLASGLVDQPDPYLRSVAGAAVGAERAEALKGVDAGRLLHTFRWIPQIHWLLANGRMPFYSEVLERTHPSDPMADDLAERQTPYTTGTVVLAQADDTFGEGTGVALGLALAEGASQAEAEARAGVPVGWLDTWRVAYPEQDWVLDVDKEGRTVTVTREAPPDAPPETVTVRVDDSLLRQTVASGSATWSLDEPPRKVVLDPGGHLKQDRLGDAWPERYFVTLSAGISSINVTRFQVFGAGSMTLRRAYDTHNLWRGVLYNSFSDVVGARVSWLHQEGPQRNGWSRPHQLTLWTNASILNPRFAATDGLQTAWGAGAVYAWDTRVFGDFPLRGKRLAIGLNGGVVPGAGESWVHVGPSALGVVALHPRHTLAGFAEATVAQANVAHRKLALGGHSVMRSLPSLPACPAVDENGEPRPCQVLADRRAMAAVEYRVAPLRNVSVPMILAWGSELQLTGGLEAVVATVDDAPAHAVGMTAGITGVADLLGAEPYLAGLTIGWPLLWSDNLQGVDQQGWPEIYLRWSQEF